MLHLGRKRRQCSRAFLSERNNQQHPNYTIGVCVIITRHIFQKQPTIQALKEWHRDVRIMTSKSSNHIIESEEHDGSSADDSWRLHGIADRILRRVHSGKPEGRCDGRGSMKTLSMRGRQFGSTHVSPTLGLASGTAPAPKSWALCEINGGDERV